MSSLSSHGTNIGTNMPIHPLQDVRILDFTSAWAGPMATRCLGYLGAQVIKVEGPTRLDNWRDTVAGAEPNRYPDLQPGPRPYNRSYRFNSQNHDKFELAVDLKHPRARKLMLRIARDCDVVIDNFSPGVMESLGLGYAQLIEVRPDIIMVEMPAYGADGPEARTVAFGPNMEAMTGMAGFMGYGDGIPVLTSGAYLDPIGGLYGASAVLTALAYRDRTGAGQYVEVPQREAAMQFVGEHFLDYIENGHTFSPQANEIMGACPHDAFPCRGHDEWIAIGVFRDEQWHNLCLALNAPSLAEDPALATILGRKEHLTDLYEQIAQRTRIWDKWELAERLQSAGIPAAPVCHGKDVAENPQLVSREFFVALDHPEAGVHSYPGLAFNLHGTPGAMRHGAPCFGEHNRLILMDWYGMTEDEVSELEQAGVIASDPAGALASIRLERTS